MTELSWSRRGDNDCLRLGGVAPGARVRVHAGTAAMDGELPPMAGTLVRDGDDLCFVPRFAFVNGTTYTVFVDAMPAAGLLRPGDDLAVTTSVLEIQPTASTVPLNLLRLYVCFSAPMREGRASGHVRIVDDAGNALPGALLATEHELWDAGRQRLTVLLDPARIKRGLVAHREVGYPLRSGAPFRLVVDEEFRDAGGAPLQAGAERRYEVGEEERRRVEPSRWTLTVPSSGTFEPIVIAFDRPLDHGLLARCLHVVGPRGAPLEGRPQVGPEERSWQLTPTRSWAPGLHRIVVDPILEDLAGNSLRRVFDRDLTQQEDEPRGAGQFSVAFRPS